MSGLECNRSFCIHADYRLTAVLWLLLISAQLCPRTQAEGVSLCWDMPLLMSKGTVKRACGNYDASSSFSWKAKSLFMFIGLSM